MESLFLWYEFAITRLTALEITKSQVIFLKNKQEKISRMENVRHLGCVCGGIEAATVVSGLSLHVLL